MIKEDCSSKIGYENKTVVVAGIDPSLRATGVVILSQSGDIIKQSLIKTKNLSGAERLIQIRNEVCELLKKNSVDVVAIEGFSFGSFGRSVFDLGGLGWILRVMLKENGYKFFDVSPSSLKAFIVKGNADKSMMMESVNQIYGISFSDDNICDAFCLAKMVMALGDRVPEFSGKGGSQKLKKLREKLALSGLQLR